MKQKYDKNNSLWQVEIYFQKKYLITELELARIK